jgi:hypothetical protein
VELDPEKQAYDPDDNHVGLDVNSVVSVATASLRPLGIEISPVVPVKYDVWVDYDGAARRIAVRMAVSGKPKPRRAVLAAPLDLGAVVADWSYFGFAASTGRKYQLNCVLAWNMTLEKLPCDDDGEDGDGKRRRMLGLAVGVPVGVAAVVGAAVLAYVCVVERRKVHGDDGNSSSAITGTMIRSLAGGPREFEYREIRKATNNFDEKMKLGQGGYGVVYRGVVVGDHTSPGGAGSAVEVAVKKFSRASTQGQNDFLAELSIINRLRHKHLVRLVGKLASPTFSLSSGRPPPRRPFLHSLFTLPSCGSHLISHMGMPINNACLNAIHSSFQAIHVQCAEHFFLFTSALCVQTN